MRKTLTVCLIVKNEEAQLERAIESVRPVADEVVVVDTGSSDGTIDLARRLGACVSSFDFADDLSAARNESIRQATGDWILAADADHELEEDSYGELLSAVEADAFRGYLLRFLNTLPSGELFETLDLRLFPRHPAVRFTFRTHERVVCTNDDLPFEHVVTGIRVRHHGNRSDEAKTRWYEQLLQHDLAERPDDMVILGYLGATYSTLGEPEKAERSYARVIELAHGSVDASTWTDVATAHAEVARLQLEDGRASEARTNARLAVALDDEFFDAHLLLGAAELQLERPREAVTEFRRAVRSRHGAPGVDTKRPLWRAYVGMAQALVRLDDIDGAARAVVRAEEDAPGHPVVVEARNRLIAFSGTMS